MLFHVLKAQYIQLNIEISISINHNYMHYLPISHPHTIFLGHSLLGVCFNWTECGAQALEQPSAIVLH